jgi:hypothetical protein
MAAATEASHCAPCFGEVAVGAKDWAARAASVGLEEVLERLLSRGS